VLTIAGGERSTALQIDAASNRLVGEPVQLPFEGFQIAVGEGAVWVASNGDETLARIDTATREVSLIPVLPGNFIGVGAGAVWLANTGIRDTVQEIDPTAARVRSTLRVGPNPYGVAIGAGSLWVPKHDDVTLSRIDLSSKEVVAEVPLPFAAHGIAFGAGTVWVIDYHGLALWPVDPATNRLGDAIRLGFLPAFAAVDEQGVWLPAFDENDTAIAEDWITRIDPHTREELESLRIGEPIGPVALGEGSIWICLQNGDVLRISP
jgi:DNA-binding beta-propeller fold protein YncE